LFPDENGYFIDQILKQKDKLKIIYFNEQDLKMVTVLLIRKDDHLAANVLLTV
jgi:hypothetical protein